jgi:hypothetical protein
MEKIKTIVIVLLVIALILLKACNPTSISTNSDKTVYIDTGSVKIDTIFADKIKYKIITKINQPIDSIRVNDTTKNEFCKYQRIYQDSTMDSNIVFYSIDTVQGLLKGKSLEYRLKVPKIIIKEYNITKTIETIKQDKFTVFGGLEVGGNKSKFNISPFLVLTNKQGNIYSCNYNLVDKTCNVGFGIKIFKK